MGFGIRNIRNHVGAGDPEASGCVKFLSMLSRWIHVKNANKDHDFINRILLANSNVVLHLAIDEHHVPAREAMVMTADS